MSSTELQDRSAIKTTKARAVDMKIAPFVVLAQWYAAHSVVRRLWAIKESQGMRVVVALEPTHDGNDIYPAWLANGHGWARELQSEMNEPVQLEVTNEPFPADPPAGVEGVVVAELYWRDPSMPPDDSPDTQATLLACRY